MQAWRQRITVGSLVVVLGMAVPAAIAASESTWQFAPGERILNATSIDLPVNDSNGTADVSAIRLPDGRIRVYFGVINNPNPGRIKSAISQDGVHFTVEPGDRMGLVPSGQISIGAASPFIYQLPDGRYRLFMSRSGGVQSATSSDGLDFTLDPGMRLERTAFQASPTTNVQVFCSAIVPLADSKYRMYCTQGVQQKQVYAALLVDRAIFSAISSNLLDWTPESGVRIGPGSAIVNDADHATVLSSAPSGAVTLLYGRRLGGGDEWKDWGEFIATSSDGLSFSKEQYTGVQGTEASFVSVSDNSGWLYYGNHNPQTGSIISAAHASLGAPPASASASPTATPKPAPTEPIRKAPDQSVHLQLSAPGAARRGSTITLRATHTPDAISGGIRFSVTLGSKSWESPMQYNLNTGSASYRFTIPRSWPVGTAKVSAAYSPPPNGPHPAETRSRLMKLS